MDSKLSFSYLKNFLEANQKRFGKIELMANRQGCFLFKLMNDSLMEEILEKGFWMIRGRLFVINK